MKQSFRVNISATTSLLLINQFSGLLLFYFLSRGLSKENFGELNWTLAFFLSLFNILSFGIDQLIIRKIASGENQNKLLCLHIIHVLFSGILFYCSLYLLSLFFPNFFANHFLLLLVGIGKTILFITTPLKALASGSERFSLLLYMSVTSTLIKVGYVTYLFYADAVSLSNVITLFIVAETIEALISVWLIRRVLKGPFLVIFSWKEYILLLKEALPQLGVVLFSSTLARMDWILIGLLLSTSKLAEYSFAYKAFEIATLPLLAIAPLLVPHFTRLIKNGYQLNDQQHVQHLLRVEMIIAGLSALCLNVIWNPLMDTLTEGKYGNINTITILILSASLPWLYWNNFLWSVHFSFGRMKTILFSFALCFAVNLIGNLCLLPLFGNEGAAFSYFLSILAQTLFYSRRMKEKSILNWRPLIFCSLCALMSGYIILNSNLKIWWLLPLGVSLYIFLLFCTVQLRKADWNLLRQSLYP